MRAIQEGTRQSIADALKALQATDMIPTGVRSFEVTDSNEQRTRSVGIGESRAIGQLRLRQNGAPGLDLGDRGGRRTTRWSHGFWLPGVRPEAWGLIVALIAIGRRREGVGDPLIERAHPQSVKSVTFGVLVNATALFDEELDDVQ